MFEITMIISLIAVVALVMGGMKLIRRGADYRYKGKLMIIAAIVLAANIAILTL